MTGREKLRAVVIVAMLVLVTLPSGASARPYKCFSSGCHDGSSWGQPKPDLTDNPGIESQRAWLSDAGQGKGQWAKEIVNNEVTTRRGSHPSYPLGYNSTYDAAAPTCRLCHRQTCISACHHAEGTWNGKNGNDLPDIRAQHTKAKPTYPEDSCNDWPGWAVIPCGVTTIPAGLPGAGTSLPVNPTDQNCAVSCHLWVKTGAEVTEEDGFTNASGIKSLSQYNGPISPAELLEDGAKVTNILGNKHSSIYHGEESGKSGGCAGFCHGGSSKPHGTIVNCASSSCHTFENLHGVHIPVVTALQPISDPASLANENQRQVVCQYCHDVPPIIGSYTTSEFPKNSVYKGSCWNCHLSGHEPVIPYFTNPLTPLSLAPPVDAAELSIP